MASNDDVKKRLKVLEGGKRPGQPPTIEDVTTALAGLASKEYRRIHSRQCAALDAAQAEAAAWVAEWERQRFPESDGVA